LRRNGGSFRCDGWRACHYWLFAKSASRDLTTNIIKPTQARAVASFNQRGDQARFTHQKSMTGDCRDEKKSKTKFRSSILQKENHMQFGSSDNFHHHRKGVSCRPPDAARSFFRWAGKLFNNPLTYIALVWGLMFLALGVTLAYAEDAAPIIRHAQR
jgi:hypothetical protein